MLRAVVDMRGLAAMAIAAGTGVWGLTAYPACHRQRVSAAHRPP